eukprot:1366350-Pleurochrysis_carterae.AAC.1
MCPRSHRVSTQAALPRNPTLERLTTSAALDVSKPTCSSCRALPPLPTSPASPLSRPPLARPPSRVQRARVRRLSSLAQQQAERDPRRRVRRLRAQRRRVETQRLVVQPAALLRQPHTHLKQNGLHAAAEWARAVWQGCAKCIRASVPLAVRGAPRACVHADATLLPAVHRQSAREGAAPMTAPQIPSLTFSTSCSLSPFARLPLKS